VRSLDDVERPLDETPDGMRCRDFAAKLQKFHTLNISSITRADIIRVSEWLTYMNQAPWEVAVVQNCVSKQLRLVNGKASKSDRIPAMVGCRYLRVKDIFILHVHPVVRSRASHVDADRKSATDILEGVLDWSDLLLCYTAERLYNRPDRRSGLEGFEDASLATVRGRIPFLGRAGEIAGYTNFDKSTSKPTYVNPFWPA
jgi:hypothetical protein